jgi:ribosomal protein RSM22 (predicted rRNA methylase)
MTHSLPPLLSAAIHEILSQHGMKIGELQAAAQDLSTAYRQYHFDQALQAKRHILSYLAVRMPATYAVVKQVLANLPANNIYSLLDLGSGPGTVLWAAQELFPELEEALLIEHHLEMIRTSKELAETVAAQRLRLEWVSKPLESFSHLPAADVVSMSYALGEIPAAHHPALLQKMFTAAKQFVVLIEPGTPRGFQALKAARQVLLAEGGSTVAPCTHDNLCPLQTDDWCHFSERISRTALHRQAKDAPLLYEDEKYSYLIIAKEARAQNNLGRIVKMPLRRSGHVRMDVCDEEGLHKITYSRKSGALYRQAKHALWGDQWNKEIKKDDK